MKKESHIIGYVWIIKNPDNPDQAIYVGQSQQPWFTIRNMLVNPASPIASVVTKLRERAPVGIEILGAIVEQQWMQKRRIEATGEYEDPIVAPAVPSGMVRLDWEIVDEPPPMADCGPLLAQPSRKDSLTEEYTGALYVGFEAMVPKWVNKLKAEGHPILNKPLGRRPGSKRKTPVQASEQAS